MVKSSRPLVYPHWNPYPEGIEGVGNEGNIPAPAENRCWECHKQPWTKSWTKISTVLSKMIVQFSLQQMSDRVVPNTLDPYSATYGMVSCVWHLLWTEPCNQPCSCKVIGTDTDIQTLCRKERKAIEACHVQRVTTKRKTYFAPYTWSTLSLQTPQVITLRSINVWCLYQCYC